MSLHPFTGGADPTDTRITLRYQEGDLMEGLGCTLHECGHALYEQGRNATYFGLPVSEAHSMVRHSDKHNYFRAASFISWY